LQSRAKSLVRTRTTAGFRIIGSDETSVRIDGRTCWNWVFQNDEVVIHLVRKSRGACVVAEVLGGHRPAIWVSDLYSAQQGHAAEWQVCLAHRRTSCAIASSPSKPGMPSSPRG